MQTFLMLVGAVMIFEGIPYFAMPDRARQVARMLGELPDGLLRIIGFGLMLGGLLLVAAASR